MSKENFSIIFEKLDEISKDENFKSYEMTYNESENIQELRKYTSEVNEINPVTYSFTR